MIRIRFKRKLQIGFLLTILPIIIIFIKIYDNSNKLEETTKALVHAQQVLFENEDLFSALADLETRSRGYAISGNQAYIKSYPSIHKELFVRLDNFQQLAFGDPTLENQFRHLKDLICIKVNFSDSVVNLTEKKGVLSAQLLISSGIGIKYMDNVRDVVLNIEKNEEQTLEQCVSENKRQAQNFNKLLIISLFAILIILSIMIYTIITNFKARRKAEKETKKSNQLFTTLFNINPASILLSELNEGLVLNANDAFLQLNGYSSKEEIIGRSTKELDILVNPQQRQEIVSLLKENRYVRNLEINIQTKHRESRWATCSLVLLKINDVPCILSVSIDITKQKKIEEKITKQKLHIEEINNELTDSISYASRLQKSMLSDEKELKKIFPKSFAINKPKDIVSGDFFLVSEYDNKKMVALADCTGHGVPGAFMSILGHAGLENAINANRSCYPSEILDSLNKFIKDNFQKSETHIQDGMDIALFCLDEENKTLTFSGAQNSLWIIRNNLFEILKGDKQPIGNYSHSKSFSSKTVSVKKGDRLFLFTDGIYDQFGGTGGKKLKQKGLQELIKNTNMFPIDKQKEEILYFLKQWKGSLPQVDDISMVAIEVN